MLSSPGALLRFSLFIDASTSDCSMDGASLHLSFYMYDMMHSLCRVGGAYGLR